MAKRRSSFHLLLPLLLVLISATATLTLLATHSAKAATRTVYSYLDSGPLTLREVVGEANSGDTINFHSSLAGHTITLESEIEITKNRLTNHQGEI